MRIDLPCRVNEMAAGDYPNEFVLLDRAMIELPDEHGVEAADLVSASGALIPVKATENHRPSAISSFRLLTAAKFSAGRTCPGG
jgi:hypothetical protein